MEGDFSQVAEKTKAESMESVVKHAAEPAVVPGHTVHGGTCNERLSSICERS